MRGKRGNNKGIGTEFGERFGFSLDVFGFSWGPGFTWGPGFSWGPGVSWGPGFRLCGQKNSSVSEAGAIPLLGT